MSATATEFITTVVIGDAARDEVDNYLPLHLNYWTNAVEEPTGYAVVPVHSKHGVMGRAWKTEAGARNYARTLQSIRYPGEDIFIIADRTFPEGDGPARFNYFVAGPVSCDIFAEYQQA